MSNSASSPSERPFQIAPRLRRTLLPALVITAIGAILLVIGFALNPERALHSYLAAYCFVTSLVIGVLILLATVHTIDAKWPIAIRRLMETVVALMPLVAIMFVPILLGMRSLYPWLRIESFTDLHTRELVQHRLAYLNIPFFITRAAIIWAVWLGFAYFLRRWSLEQDISASPELLIKMRRLSAGSLPVIGITLTIASFDWLMSLNPEWYTTMYGIYVFAGSFLAGIALVTIIALAVERRDLISPLNPSHYYALGRLLLAFTIFWAYIAYFQFFLIWIGNRPSEATWYVERMQSGWGGVSIFLALGRFALPFLFLLPYVLKWHRWPLRIIAAFILMSHYVDCYWLVMPSLHQGFRISLYDIGAILFICGGAFAYGLWSAARRPITVLGDSRLAESLAYDSK